MVFLGALFLLCVWAMIALSEEERIEDYAERQQVNRMADRSRRGWGGRRRQKAWMR